MFIMDTVKMKKMILFENGLVLLGAGFVTNLVSAALLSINAARRIQEQ